jgi:hypothetical protein
MRRVLKILSVACVFGAGCYATIAWPGLSPHVAGLLKPVMSYLESPQLAEARLADVGALKADLEICQERLDAQERAIAGARAREQQLEGDLVKLRDERDQALLEARRAGERYAQLCHDIRALDLTGSPVPALAQE